VSRTFLAIVNPAAGGGRCAKLVNRALDQLRSAGVSLEIEHTTHAGHASELARDGYSHGSRNFLAVGGDGTSYEVVNGLFPAAQNGERPLLGFLPLGTGNSFLRDFSHDGLKHATHALIEGRRHPCDVLRLKYRTGVLHYINLLSIGFAADVAAMRLHRFNRMGQLGYLLAVFVCLVRLQRRAFPLHTDADPELDRRPCLFLTFNNSKFTGGKMMIAPKADISDGLIEYVRWGPIGRLALLKNLPTLYDGTHLQHPLASRHAVRRVHFELQEPVDVMIDGEVLRLHCEQLDVLPSALDVVA
jgi:YegS/Rv2252/BmrU family lipid kinase